MAHIKPRALKPGNGGKPRKAYLVRWIDAAGKERARQFPRMTDAKRFKVEIETALMRGTYVDPRAGDITLKLYAEKWRRGKLNHRPKTAAQVARDLAHYVYPCIGDLRIGAARRDDLQEWVGWLTRQPTLFARKNGAGASPAVRTLAPSSIANGGDHGQRGVRHSGARRPDHP
ncbi:MAG: hypothetical protein ACRDSH_05625 [Pseudonocardiaceae bacterium]